MAKYLIKRILRGIVSIIIVVAVVMVLVYTFIDRSQIFSSDSVYLKQSNNQKITYEYKKWEEYGYLDYIPYADYLTELTTAGELDEETRAKAVAIGRSPEKDSEVAAEYVAKFTEKYAAMGYTVERLPVVTVSKNSNKLAKGGNQALFAYKDKPLISRLWTYLTGIIKVENIYNAEGIPDEERGISFTWYDPVYQKEDGEKVFSPAIIGNGTTHKYLLYFDKSFPYLHQNLVRINLGISYAVNSGIDIVDTMTRSQGMIAPKTVTFPTGLTEETADDLHTATYVEGSLALSEVYQQRYLDDYTNVYAAKSGLSKVAYSFIIGIIAVIVAYLLGVPIGILMAQKKDKFVDKLGTLYIIFIIAVPSLAYIFMFRAIGESIGLPITFKVDTTSKLIYILPMISLALPSVAGLMKWLRRYMIDQMNSDYVRFARSNGLSEGEIFSKHILKNAAIPIIHGIPGDILFALVGAIITERVYTVPGAGGLLTDAINVYDNGVIVGMTLFYAALSVLAIIFGDILMSMVDPRISFSTKGR